MIFYLNSISKIVLIKWSNAREIHILTPNMLKEKWNETNVNLETLN